MARLGPYRCIGLPARQRFNQLARIGVSFNTYVPANKHRESGAPVLYAGAQNLPSKTPVSRMFPRVNPAAGEATGSRATVLATPGRRERIDAGVCHIAGEVTLTRDP
jgi:hypothetical protein